MHILLADDETPKLQSIQDFVCASYGDVTVRVARSVRTAIASMRETAPVLVLLDMSLPTFDVAPGEPGGRPQGFGGLEVLTDMDFYMLRAPVILITQYEAFPDQGGGHVDLSELREKMAIEHPHNFFGCVYYAAMNEGWQLETKKLMDTLLPGRAL